MLNFLCAVREQRDPRFRTRLQVKELVVPGTIIEETAEALSLCILQSEVFGMLDLLFPARCKGRPAARRVVSRESAEVTSCSRDERITHWPIG